MSDTGALLLMQIAGAGVVLAIALGLPVFLLSARTIRRPGPRERGAVTNTRPSPAGLIHLVYSALIIGLGFANDSAIIGAIGIIVFFHVPPSYWVKSD